MVNKRNTKAYTVARLITVSLLVVLTLGYSVSAVGASESEKTEITDSLYPPKEHSDVDFADMEYTGVDGTETEELLQELQNLTNGITTVDDPEKRTVELYEEILAEMNSQYTQYTLGDVKHYIDVTDEAVSEQVIEDTILMQDLSDKCTLVLKEALDGPYADQLEDCFTDEQLENIREYKALTDLERELIERETDLIQQYDRVSEVEYTFDYKGRTWTMDELYADTPEDYSDIETIYLGLSQKQNEATVPIYQELVKVRKQIAEEEGYDNYTDYAYDITYGRDFTGDDIAALRHTVINELVPLYNVLETELYYERFDTELPEPVSGDEIVETLAPYMEKVSSKLVEAYNYLQKHHLYHIDNTSKMVEAGFTADLPSYGSAFIYSKTAGNIRDYETIVHEFGHFNAAYHAKQNVLMDSLLVDVAEIQSQGLEMLFMEYMKEILDDESAGLELYLVVNMLESVISGFEFDEFQQEVYARDDMTVDELNELAWEIDSRYTSYFYEDNGKAYEWTEINHTFSSPLYYIGYATSALSALDIWTESLENRDAAIDKYLKLTAVPLDMPYQEAITCCGLRNMLKTKNINSLRDEILQWSKGIGLPYTISADEEEDWDEHMDNLFNGEPDLQPYIDESDTYSYDGELEELTETGRKIVSVSSAVSLVRLIITIIILIVYLKKKSRLRQNGSGNDPGSNGWNHTGNGNNWNQR